MFTKNTINRCGFSNRHYAVWMITTILSAISWFYFPSLTSGLLLSLSFQMVAIAIYALAQSKPRDPLPMWIFIGSQIALGAAYITAPAF